MGWKFTESTKQWNKTDTNINQHQLQKFTTTKMFCPQKSMTKNKRKMAVPQSHPYGFLRQRHYSERSHIFPIWPSGMKALWWLLPCANDMVVRSKTKMAGELLQLVFPTPSLKTMKKQWQHPQGAGCLSRVISPLCWAQFHAGTYVIATIALLCWRLVPMGCFCFCIAPPSSLLVRLGSLLARLGTDIFDLSAVLGGKAVPLRDSSLSP